MNALKFVPKILTTKVGRTVLVARKNSPTLMFTAGVAGFVTTTVLAAKATLKVEEVLGEMAEKRDQAEAMFRRSSAWDLSSSQSDSAEQIDYSQKDLQSDQYKIRVQGVVKLAKLYALPIGVGVLSVGLLTGSHVVLTRRNAAVTAAYATMAKGFSEYRARVVEEFGEDKDRQLRYAGEEITVVEETENGPVVKTVHQPGIKGASIYARFFDETARDWSREPGRNQFFIQCQQNYMNDLLKTRGHVFLNEVYDALGIERSKAGAIVGWVLGHGDDFVDFGVFRNDQWQGTRFVNGEERSILLDFNVDGVIYDMLDK